MSLVATETEGSYWPPPLAIGSRSVTGFSKKPLQQQHCCVAWPAALEPTGSSAEDCLVCEYPQGGCPLHPWPGTDRASAVRHIRDEPPLLPAAAASPSLSLELGLPLAAHLPWHGSTELWLLCTNTFHVLPMEIRDRARQVCVWRGGTVGKHWGLVVCVKCQWWSLYSAAILCSLNGLWWYNNYLPVAAMW